MTTADWWAIPAGLVAAAIVVGIDLYAGGAYVAGAAALAAILGAGIALIAARARRRSQRTMRRFEVLDQVAGIADGSLSLSDTLSRVTDLAVPDLADMCMIDVFREGRVTRAATRVDGSAELEEAIANRKPSPPVNMIEPGGRSAGEPRFIRQFDEETLRELSHDAEDLELLRRVNPTAAITAPLTARNQLLGAITLVLRGARRSYADDDLRFARVFAGRVALALDNAGLFSDLESVERRMDAVMSILDEAVLVHDAGGELVYANESAARLMGFDSVDELIATPVSELPARLQMRREDDTPLPAEQLPSSRVLAGEETPSQLLRCVDPRAGGERWLLTRSQAIRGPDRTALYAVTTIEDTTELKRREIGQSMLARTGELLASSLDYRETLRNVAGLAVPELADWCTLSVPREDGLIELLALQHRDPEKAKLAERIVEWYPGRVDDPTGAAEVLRTGEAQVVENAGEMMEQLAQDDRHRELLRELGAGAAMIQPMRGGGQVVGVLTLVNDADRGPFDEHQVSLAGELATRAGVAIENARMATERSEIASALQQGLLPPPLPEIPGWSVAAFYRPAGTENEVGGDFYDVFRSEDSWMLLVGDVVGKGATAAAITALVRYTMRTAGTLTGDPVRSLELLNKTLLEREGRALCSLAVIALRGNGEAGRIEVGLAGHPPPLRISGGTVEEVAPAGALLGAFEKGTWEKAELEVSPGEQLVIYTDGVIEAQGAGERYGEERLRSQLATADSPARVISLVDHELDRFIRGEPDDDAAVLAVMRQAPLTAGAPTSVAPEQAEMR